MSQLTIAELQIELQERVRSAGRGGKTTAEDLRIFLNHLLETVDALRTQLGNGGIDGTNFVHKTGDEVIAGAKTFSGAVAVSGQSSTGVISVNSLSDQNSVSIGNFFAPNAGR